MHSTFRPNITPRIGSRRNLIIVLFFACLLIGGSTLVVGTLALRARQSRVIALERELQRARESVESLELSQQELKDTLQTREATLLSLEESSTQQNLVLVEKRLQSIQVSLTSAEILYEELLDITEGKGKASPAQRSFARFFASLRGVDEEAVKSAIATLQKELKNEQLRLATQSATLPVTITTTNPPDSGYRRQRVVTTQGDFSVDIIAADLKTTKVVIDTASDSSCTDNCPVLPLATYVARSGAYAGINGTYFCPESYPSCSTKKNSFDLLVMNSKKTYFNSDNNVYSQNPVAIFSNGNVRFLSKAESWGRDTSVDAVISNFPLLLINGSITTSSVSDNKMSGKGNRGFIATRGSSVYIGFVRSATVPEAAIVLKTMGMDHGMNLDSGGSSALWSGGYKIGPGRNIPNAILFVRR